MKTKKILFILLTVLLSYPSFSQNKQLTIEDATVGKYRNLAPDDIYNLQWRGDSHEFSYTKDFQKLYTSDITCKNPKELSSVYKINTQLINDGLKKITNVYGIKWLDKDKFVHIVNEFAYVYDTKKNDVVTSFDAFEGADELFYNEKANAVAYCNENALFMLDSKRRLTKIAADYNKDITFGSDYVHRQEFGINKGIFWSPEGNYIAFYRNDQSKVANFPLIDYTTFPASVKNIKYPMTGQTSEEVTLGVYNINSKKTVYMQTGEHKDHYLTSITWDPSENYIYIAILNREQNHLKFNKYDANSGKLVKTLFEEKSDKYVEPEHPAIFLPKSKNKFLWYSQRDGYKHLYLYDTDGNLIRQVTQGDWIVTDFYGFSPDEQDIYIQSTAVCGIQRHVFRVGLFKNKFEELTKEHGCHEVVFSADKNYFIDKFSSTDVPNNIEIINAKKAKLESRLLQAQNPLEDYNIGEMKIGQIKAADGKTDLYYRIITPPNFDKTKKYPVVVYVYGGPHAQLITDTWMGDVNYWQLYMAQKGYVAFTIDNRGSANRGFEFESAVFHKLGVEEMKDQLEGIKYLETLPYVDKNRIGVFGWSFGGFMTSSLLTTYGDIFKVGVAGGPVIDWKFYEVMYGERYMGTPRNNADNFEKVSLLNKIQNLKGKLLIIQGGIDPVVVPQNANSLLLKSIELGVQVDYFTYPNSEHNVRYPKRIHLLQKVSNYFDQNL